jgi:hypothetical protein
MGREWGGEETVALKLHYAEETNDCGVARTRGGSDAGSGPGGGGGSDAGSGRNGGAMAWAWGRRRRRVPSQWGPRGREGRSPPWRRVSEWEGERGRGWTPRVRERRGRKEGGGGWLGQGGARHG